MYAPGLMNKNVDCRYTGNYGRKLNPTRQRTTGSGNILRLIVEENGQTIEYGVPCDDIWQEHIMYRV